ncbi:hypothetical protein Emag_000516 [Eimeria magna]
MRNRGSKLNQRPTASCRHPHIRTHPLNRLICLHFRPSLSFSLRLLHGQPSLLLYLAYLTHHCGGDFYDQKRYQQQHPQTYSGSPSFVSSAHSFESAAGDVSNSWDEGQAEESFGIAGGDSGVLDLADGVSQWKVSSPKEDQEAQGSPAGAGVESGLLDLADSVLQWAVPDAKEDEDDD